MSSDAKEKLLELHYARRTGLGGVLDTVVSILFWHYIFTSLVAAGICTVAGVLKWLDWRTIGALLLIYCVQLVFWRPQYKKGFFLWRSFMHQPYLDGILRLMNGVFIREAELDSERRYLFAWAPHGILGVVRAGTGGSAWERLFPGIYPRWGGFSAGFYIPGCREISLCGGSVDASFKTLSNLEESVHLTPGGIREMNLTDPDSKVTYHTVKERYGFVKLAQTCNMKIVPAMCFGEKWLHMRAEFPWPFNALVRSLGCSPLYPYGRWGTLLPLKCDNIGWVCGHPIETQNRSMEEIHQEYCNQVQRIFDGYKKRFGYDDDETLMIVEPSFQPKKHATGDKECKKQE